MKVKIVSWNIHKGFNFANTKFILEQIRELLRETKADILFLQEVVGENKKHALNLNQWPSEGQFEFLADQNWDFQAYGKNAVWTDRHHGNAILSKFEILKSENIDLTVNKFEYRGLLHAVLDIEGKSVDLFNVHLNLLHKHRLLQVEQIIERALTSLNSDILILGGDFNDWTGSVSHMLEDRIGLSEVFLLSNGAHARTFPSFMPLLPLDRVYFKGASLIHCEVLKNSEFKYLSDHLPVMVEFEI
ncbi:MAG: EEP domain-containing protein [Deltaproteobacteria bacterium]|nr:MAG: EEP domain-containing protein [Deltaproteobacteria bacterium]TNF25845.1 MAG: EEP domain-containing protein [Deltaproteobacteria bacterium]